jgi:predicted nucleic acid-binding protein
VIVVDASVLATALADDGNDGRRVRARLVDEQLSAPELVDLEVTSVLRKLCAAQLLDVDRADQALTDLHALRLERVPHRPLLRRCWELRHNVTVYDASYIALAEMLDASLITADERLTRASGTRCTFELMN